MPLTRQVCFVSQQENNAEGDDRAHRQRQQRRREIIEAAKAVFAERGYHSASISDIIGAAKIARGTFYLYFTSKHHVFDSILEEALQELRSRISRIDVSEGAPPPQVQLRANLVRVMEFAVGDPHFSRVLLRARGQDKEVTERVEGFYAHVGELLEASLEYGIELGLVRQCDTALVASALLGAVRGIIDHLITSEGSIDIEVVVDELLRFALGGVISSGDRWLSGRE